MPMYENIFYWLYQIASHYSWNDSDGSGSWSGGGLGGGGGGAW